MTPQDEQVGYLHSTESFGTVDGPGIRMVLFLSGCPLRCAYCHNPDTWESASGQRTTAEAILAAYRKNKAFYRDGGITASGGEPLCQLPFLTHLFRRAKAEGIHTCLDTSGILFSDSTKEAIDRLLDVTDLILLDIKHIDTEKHRALTGMGNEPVLAFAAHLAARAIPICVRHVLIPHVTDTPGDLLRLGHFIGTLPNLKALDVLPYHTLGVSKYTALGIPFPLDGIPPATKDEALAAKRLILTGVREARAKTSRPS